MDECNLDWKKVFKEILGDKSQSPLDSISSEECEKGPYSYISFSSEVKESGQCGSSCSSEVKNFNNDNCENHDSYCYVPCKTIPKLTSVSKRSSAKRSTSQSYLERTNNLPNFRENDKVPEWNKVFKCILGNNSARDAQERKDIEYTLKKAETLQKQNEPANNKKCYRKKKISDSVFKMDEEEKKVREMFALSRLFKLECPFNSLNDFAGSGVDIFKCDKKLISPFTSSCEKNESESELDDDSCDQYSELSVPVTGLIANIKRLTRDDIINSPCVPLTEVWDDGFLF